jgi:hypothetical protein
VRFRLLVGIATLLVIALPAQARASGFSGVVVAKQLHRGTIVIASRGGAGLTVRGNVANVRLGDRVRLQGARLRDGTVKASGLRVLARIHRATIRGTVVRALAHTTLVATGRSVIVIHSATRAVASASDNGDLKTGARAEFHVRIEDELFENAPPLMLGQVAQVEIEGSVVSVSPFVVSIEGLPIPITVPSGVTLPATLAPGQRIELTVQVLAAGSFTLVAIDEVENANPAVVQEVEVEGFVVSSTASQLVVNAGGALFTFVAPTGATLPIVAPGTKVEARGASQNGVLTLTRLRLRSDGDGSGGDGGGGGDGGH